MSRTEFLLFNDPATTEIYTLSLHDALPILVTGRESNRWRTRGRLHTLQFHPADSRIAVGYKDGPWVSVDRKSTRLNSSHGYISYAVFCLKKKKRRTATHRPPIEAQSVINAT